MLKKKVVLAGHKMNGRKYVLLVWRCNVCVPTWKLLLSIDLCILYVNIHRACCGFDLMLLIVVLWHCRRMLLCDDWLVCDCGWSQNAHYSTKCDVRCSSLVFPLLSLLIGKLIHHIVILMKKPFTLMKINHIVIHSIKSFHSNSIQNTIHQYNTYSFFMQTYYLPKV